MLVVLQSTGGFVARSTEGKDTNPGGVVIPLSNSLTLTLCLRPLPSAALQQSTPRTELWKVVRDGTSGRH